MEIKAAIEKNGPFCVCLESMWHYMLEWGNQGGYLVSVHDRIAGAALWVKCRSKEEDELIFLRDLLADQRGIYEVKREAV